MGDILGAIGGAVSGLGLGFLGALAKGGLSLFKDHQDHKHLVEMRRLDMELMSKEASFALERQELETNEALFSAQASEVVAAHQEESSFSGSLWVRDLKGMVRPLLAILFTSFFGFMLIRALHLWTMTPEVAYQIVLGAIVTTQAVTSFYFGDRTISRRLDPQGNEG